MADRKILKALTDLKALAFVLVNVRKDNCSRVLRVCEIRVKETRFQESAKTL